MQEYNRAWVLFGQNRIDESNALLQAIIERDKTFTPAYEALNLGYANKGLGANSLETYKPF